MNVTCAKEIRRRTCRVFQISLSVGVLLFEVIVDNVDVSKLAIQIRSMEEDNYSIMSGIIARVRAFSGTVTLGGMEGSEHFS